MASLEVEDRNKLLRMLVGLPLFQNYRGRRQLLELAGLEMVIPQVDLEGPPLVAVGELIQVLEAYGRVTYSHEALGLLLNSVKESIGAGDPAQQFLDEVLTRYSLMTPVKRTDPVSGWKHPVDVAATEEKIIGENTLRHISFLQRGLEAARSVALVDARDWTGTGFLINADLLLTNNHVLPTVDTLPHTSIRLNYQLTFDGREEAVTTFKPKRDGLFYTDKTLDFTIVELDGSPGTVWGTLPLSTAGVSKDERVNIIQHPAGMPKQISFQNNFVQYADSRVVQYLTSTLSGSSGSPVMNDEWRVVALHHAGGMVLEPNTGRTYFRNEGISISAILNGLPVEVRQRLEAAAA
jgi:hypothetical protein